MMRKIITFLLLISFSLSCTYQIEPSELVVYSKNCNVLIKDVKGNILFNITTNETVNSFPLNWGEYTLTIDNSTFSNIFVPKKLDFNFLADLIKVGIVGAVFFVFLSIIYGIYELKIITFIFFIITVLLYVLIPYSNTAMYFNICAVITGGILIMTFLSALLDKRLIYKTGVKS